MSANLCFTTDSLFFLSSFFRQLLSALAERNSTKTGHMLGSEYDLKMHVLTLGYLIPLQIGSPKHFFRPFYNLTATLTAYIIGTKRDINKRLVHWQLGGVSCIVSKQHKFWSTNCFTLDASFHPPYVNSPFSFIARLRRQRSANGTKLCQTVDAKSR